MIKAVVLIPLYDNSGQPFGRSDYVRFETAMLDVAGGFTRRRGAEGVWRDDTGEVFIDEGLEYTVALASWRDICSWLDAVEVVRVEFRQIALYVEIAGVPEILRAP